jgi:hypothetical protein
VIHGNCHTGNDHCKPGTKKETRHDAETQESERETNPVFRLSAAKGRVEGSPETQVHKFSPAADESPQDGEARQPDASPHGQTAPH